jgi:hypothetical protein
VGDVALNDAWIEAAFLEFTPAVAAPEAAALVAMKLHLDDIRALQAGFSENHGTVDGLELLGLSKTASIDRRWMCGFLPAPNGRKRQP